MLQDVSFACTCVGVEGPFSRISLLSNFIPWGLLFAVMSCVQNSLYSYEGLIVGSLNRSGVHLVTCTFLYFSQVANIAIFMGVIELARW